jgi:hypothetical protein
MIGLALLLALSGVVTPPTAQAAMSVNVICDSGLNHFTCDAYPSGGIAPYSYSWQGITNAGITTSTTNAWVTGTCLSWIPNPTYTVQVTVRDSTGATVIKQGGGGCRSGQWQ